MQLDHLLPKQLADTGRGPRLLALFAVFVLTAATLACAFGRAGSQPLAGRARDSHLPTLTRTPLPTLTATAASAAQQMAAASGPAESLPPTSFPLPADLPIAEATPVTSEAQPVAEIAAAAASSTPANTATLPPTDTPTATATPTVPPSPTATETPAPTATPTETPLPTGWIFSSARSSTYDDSNLILYGDMLNNTGAAQKLAYITGTFLDAGGQVVADEDSTLDYWPVDTIPQGARLPFKLTAIGVQNAANFNLRAEAAPSNDSPVLDFEFSEVNTSNQTDTYCLAGKLKNLGGGVSSYLVILAILYDNSNSVINFNHFYQTQPNMAGGQITDFKVCVDPLNQNVSRYDLRAWGQ